MGFKNRYSAANSKQPVTYKNQEGTDCQRAQDSGWQRLNRQKGTWKSTKFPRRPASLNNLSKK